MKSILIKLKGHPHVQKGTAYTILFAMGFCHLLNDMIQSVIPAMYPVLKDNFGFTFAQIGIITLVFQLTSSVFQPFVGQYADRRPQPYSLSAGMCFTLTGLLLLAFASNFFLILLAVAIIGCGSSVFHPEASRVAQIASGGRKSLAQSIFQVGGNGGSAIGPLLAALIIIPYGQHAVGWFSIAALLASAILVYATDLKPDKVGMISGIFFGLMFGLGGIGSAFFGWLADETSIEFIFKVSTLLPLLGIIAGFLPNIKPSNR